MIDRYIEECRKRIYEEADNVIGESTIIRHPHLVNIFGTTIGEDCIIGPFVEIQRDTTIGDRVKIQSHSFICEGVRIEENVFIGHGVMFTNDKNPRSVNKKGKLIKSHSEWIMEETIVKKGVSIGSNATILSGITLAENSVIGAGAVVTKDTDVGMTYVGNPAKSI